MSTGKQLHLNAFLMSTGHHEASWRLPESDPHANLSLAAHQHLTRVAEEAKFDSVFLADSPVLWSDPGRRPAGKLEPTLLLAALAATTTRIGLIATASTSYNEPFNLARRFASLDHLSGGRAGWNIVTTAGEAAARNFGLDEQPQHRRRPVERDDRHTLAPLRAAWIDHAARRVVIDARELGDAEMPSLSRQGALSDDEVRRFDEGNERVFDAADRLNRVWSLFSPTVTMLTTLGLLQYIAPTLQFLLGITVGGEPMPAGRWAGFIVIWMALALFTYDSWRDWRTARARVEASAAL